MNERGAFSIAEFCNWAGIGRTMAYQQIGEGKLPTLKIGKRTLIRVSDAEAWLASLVKNTGANGAPAKEAA